MFLKKRFFIILFAIAAISAFGVVVNALYGVAIVLLCLFAAASIAPAMLEVRENAVSSHFPSGLSLGVQETATITTAIMQAAREISFFILTVD